MKKLENEQEIKSRTWMQSRNYKKIGQRCVLHMEDNMVLFWNLKDDHK
jgi:hypothetical protein